MCVHVYSSLQNGEMLQTSHASQSAPVLLTAKKEDEKTPETDQNLRLINFASTSQTHAWARSQSCKAYASLISLSREGNMNSWPDSSFTSSNVCFSLDNMLFPAQCVSACLTGSSENRKHELIARLVLHFLPRLFLRNSNPAKKRPDKGVDCSRYHCRYTR